MKLKLVMQINLHRTEFGIYCMVVSGVNVSYYSSNLYRPTNDFIYACMEPFGRTCVRIQNDHTPLLVMVCVCC